MTTNTLTPVVQHLHAFASRSTDRSDDELLRAFAASRDESAFAAIVRRYGRLVLAVCRRALRHEHDAEDAFQATFLVLARSASSIRKGQSLAAWLHGVSYRVSLKARQQAGRRRSVQARASRGEAETPSDGLAWSEVRAALDEEVARLPQLYRDPFVLCCLQGASRAEAAERLGIKDGTLSSRLAAGRKRLQEALARRGVVLGLLTGPAVPPGLTAKAIGMASRSCDAISETVARLASATTSATPWGKLVAAFVMLGALAAAVGGVGTPSRATAEKPTPTGAAKEESPSVEVKGRVLDPNGKPVSGANLSLFRPADADKEKSSHAAGPTDGTTSSLFRPADADKEKVVLARTDEAGTFAFRLPAADAKGDVKLVAASKGYAAAWQDLAPSKEATLKLRAADVALTGRALSLEGLPLAGVPVHISWVGEHPQDKLGDWINYFLARNKMGYWINEGGLRIIRPQALGLPRTVTTGKDGTFRVEGVGRDRVVTMFFRGEKTVTVRLQVATREGPKEGWVKGDYGLYPTGFTFVLGPCKQIFGTIRDKKTGKPVVGLTVSDARFHTYVKTDEKGEYRLFGSAKQKNYIVGMGGRPGVPYIDYTVHDLADTAAFEPLRADFDLERGVEIRGKVIDERTGKPVRGSVHYYYRTDNPHLKDYATIDGAKMIVSDWGKIAEDGSFTVLGIPGPGALVVQARESTSYARVDARKRLEEMKVRSFPTSPTHAVVAIDAKENEPSSLAYTIRLTPAGSRTARLVDAEGKPVIGAAVVGHSDDKKQRTLTTGEVVVTGLRAARARALVAIHEGRQLGAVAGVDGGSTQSIDVKMQPLGTLTGRLVDGEGNALAGRTVRLYLWLDAKKYENLPTEHRVKQAFSLVDGSWSDFTSREVRTDKEGRFRIVGLIAGERYDLVGGEGKLSDPETVTHFGFEARPEAGQVKDVGDVKPKRTR